MIIQNGNYANQQSPPAGRVSDDASRVVLAAAGVGAGRGVELPQGTAQPVASRPVPAEQLKQAVETINKALKLSNRNLEFSVDEESHRVIVKLTDTETGEVIRQIPSEETLAISRSIGEFQQGLLLHRQA